MDRSSLLASVFDCAAIPNLKANIQLSRSYAGSITCQVRNNRHQMRLHALPGRAQQGKVLFMTRRWFTDSQRFSAGSFVRALTILLSLVGAPTRTPAEAPAAAISSFNTYVGKVEARLIRQRGSQPGFIAPVSPQDQMRLRQGELIVEKLTHSTGAELPGVMLHDWRGTAFVAGATATDFERLMRDFNAYPKHFSPQVVSAKILMQQGDRFQTVMRVRQRHVITVVMDTTYDVTFGRLDPRHGYSISRSTKIAEIDSPGNRNERALTPKQEHGFLWRLNTYWSYEERDGGVYMQIESVSLTRSIPAGLGWAVGPFVESVPRESLEFTLRSVSNALRR
jgi:hypothetical protein